MNPKRDTTSATNSMSRRSRRRIGRAPLALLAALALALMVPVREAGGQGQVSFNNHIPGGAGVGITTHIWGPSTNNACLALIGLGSNDSPSGTTPFAASGMALIGAGGSGGQYGYATTFAQLIGAVGANQPESALVPVGQTTTFRSQSSLLGCLAGITVTLTNNPGGSIVIPAGAAAATFEIVAWDNSSGVYPTWAQASAAWEQGLIAAGHSAPFTVTNIGDGMFILPPHLNNGQGTNNGMASFNLRRFGGTVTTLWALQVKATSAQISGMVNPSGGSAWFEWGTTTDYGNVTSAPFINWDGLFGVPLGPLNPGTTYYFRAAAGGGSCTVYGAGMSFTTQTQPTISVTTLPATDVTTHSATLNGAVYGTTEQTWAWWEFGTTTNYGSYTSTAPLGDGPMPPYYLDGLTPGTTYHFRAVAHNSSTNGYGGDESFTTLMPPALTLNTGSGYWDAASSTLSYAGGSAQSFILLQSADPTAPLSAWTRVATNYSAPGSFTIPPVGTAAPKYYRVKSE